MLNTFDYQLTEVYDKSINFLIREIKQERWYIKIIALQISIFLLRDNIKPLAMVWYTSAVM